MYRLLLLLQVFWLPLSSTSNNRNPASFPTNQLLSLDLGSFPSQISELIENTQCTYLLLTNIFKLSYFYIPNVRIGIIIYLHSIRPRFI